MKKKIAILLVSGLLCCNATPVMASDVDSMSLEELKEAYKELESKYNELLAQTTEPQSDAEAEVASDFQYSQDGFTYKYLKNEVKTIDGSDYVYIFFEYTNDSGETSTPYYSLATTAYQNGVQIDSYISIQDGVPEADVAFKEVKTGTTVDIALKFALSDDSPVSVEISPMLTYGDTEIGEFTFDLNN